MHGTERWAGAAQQGSTAGCSKEKMPCGFFPCCCDSVYTQHTHAERKDGPSVA